MAVVSISMPDPATEQRVLNFVQSRKRATIFSVVRKCGGKSYQSQNVAAVTLMHLIKANKICQNEQNGVLCVA